MKAPDYTVSAAQSVVRATVARALATALITGINHARHEDHELSELQQIDLATMHVMAYDHALDACDAMKAESTLLSSLRRIGEERASGN